MANHDRSAGLPPDRPIEHLLVMHCLKEDSVLGREGFSVRAASPGASDRATMEWALKLDPYELPLDMKSGLLLGSQAPRRLAMVPGPSGQMAVVHTAYLPEDTVGRSHSFVSQVLLLPEVSTLEAVAAWGSSDWQTDEYPRGETKTLTPLEGPPRGPLIDEAMVSAFLSGASAPPDQSLARTVYPVRVQSSPEARRRWVRAALHGFVLTVEPGSQRTRVCILAEPGAVALLVYAIARLLPPQWVGAVPFSTYEPPHTSLRENRVARVIGSYARNGLDRTDSDALRRKGYVVDTFRDTYGPDLMIEPSWPLEGLLDLAAAGDWAGVDEIRELWAGDPKLARGATPAALAEVVRIRPLAGALRSGTIGIEGLLELRRNRFGEGLLRDPALRLSSWRALKPVWTQPGIRADFSDLLQEHVDELAEEVGRMAQSGRPGAWREGWEILKPILPAERRLADLTTLLERVGRGPSASAVPADVRVAMVREWSQLAQKEDSVPTPLQWLLHFDDPAGFRTLARSGVDPRHAGLAAGLALAGDAAEEAACAIVQELNDDALRAMIEGLAGAPHRDAFIERVRSDAGSATAMVERLLACRAKISTSRIEELLAEIRVDEVVGEDFWLADGHLEGLLDLLPSDSPLSMRLWKRLLARITSDNFAAGDPMGHEMEALRGARERFPSSLAAGDRDRLDGWISLRALFRHPPKEAPPGGSALKLRKACEAAGQTREGLTRDWFVGRVLTVTDDLERRRQNEALGRVLLWMYERENDAWYAARKLLADARDDHQRRLCEADLQIAILSEETRERQAKAGRSGPALDPPGGGGKARWSRLASRGKPYAGAFAAGCLFTLLLLVLLWPVLSGALDAISTWRRPATAAREHAAGKEAVRDLEARLVRSRKESEDARSLLATATGKAEGLEDQLKKARTEVDSLRGRNAAMEGELNRLRGRLASAGKDAAPATMAPGAGSPAGSDRAASKGEAAGTSAEDADRAAAVADLTRLIFTNPVEPQQYNHVIRVAEAVEKKATATFAPALATTVKRLLSGLRAYDLEIDHLQPVLKDQPMRGDTKADFSFLAGGSGSQPMLATRRPVPPLRSRLSNRTLSFYTSLIPEGAKDPKGVVTLVDHDFLASTPSGSSFLVSRNDLHPKEVYLIDSERFYDENKQKTGNDDAVPNGPRMDLAIDPEDAIALSNDATKIAIARPASDFDRAPPDISVRKLSKKKRPRRGAASAPTDDAGKAKEPDLIDFRPSDLGLDARSRLVAMSFDEPGTSLLVSFEGKKDLLIFELGGARPPLRISIPNPIRGWSLRQDGKVAVISDPGIQLYSRPESGDPGKEMRPYLPSRISSRPTCVAFAPRGTVLAVGDERSVVIRSLARPHNGMEVLRLAHVGPVTKVAFSPHGRVLAALARPPVSRGDLEGGVIRIWVSENWEGAPDGERASARPGGAEASVPSR